MRIAAISTVALGVALTACEDREPRGYVHIGPDKLPTESYARPPKNPRSDDYVVKLENMISFYDVPGEAGFLMEGADHGFESLSDMRHRARRAVGLIDPRRWSAKRSDVLLDDLINLFH